MKSRYPMNQFPGIASSIFTLQFREVKCLQEKNKTHQNPQWNTAFISIPTPRPHKPYAQSEPSPHRLSDRCPSPAHAWSPASRSGWDLVPPWHRSSGWWGRSRFPCWNLASVASPVASWLQQKSNPMAQSLWWYRIIPLKQQLNQNHCFIETLIWRFFPVSDVVKVWRSAPSNQPLGQFVFRSHLWRRWRWGISCPQPAQGVAFPSGYD